MSTRFTRRHLPHVDVGVAIYFATAHLRAMQLTLDEISLVRNYLVSTSRPFYDLLATQVMPDHLHILCRTRPGFPLRRLMKGIKGTTARLLNQQRGSRGRLWQDESFD